MSRHVVLHRSLVLAPGDKGRVGGTRTRYGRQTESTGLSTRQQEKSLPNTKRLTNAYTDVAQRGSVVFLVNHETVIL